MSRKKDLFKKQNPNKFIGSANFDKLTEEVESKNFIKEKVKQDRLFTPRVDFSDPANFAKYGLAEEYYRTSIENIYKTYPYDGSLAEREAWYNKSSYLDQYILDTEYPSSNGYVLIGTDWGTTTTITDYGLPSTLEYITFNGGPHGGFGSLKDPRTENIDGERGGSLANIFKSAKNRENNLKVDLTKGTTVEFWLKKDSFDPSLTKREVIFDLWNGQASSSNDYGRLTIELTSSQVQSGPAFLVTCQSGTAGFVTQSLSTITTASVADGAWHHYAFSFLSASGGTITTTLYKDGQYIVQSGLGTAISSIPLLSTGMSASIGALRTSPSGNVYHGTTMNGAGKLLESSIDEFRFWKTERSARQIFQNYNFQVGGGTNTDDANTLLGVYYKFNEGVTTNTSVDAKVLDYSGRVSNGTFVGYSTTSRNTGSAFISSSASLTEFEDPIIYSFHPDVVTLKTRLQESGSFHDNQNNSALFYTMPSWIIEEDESTGGKNLRYLTQIMSSYLDTAYLQIQELTTLKNIKYTSGSVKPSVFGDRFLSDKGLISPELFVDASVIEKLYDRNEKTGFEKELSEIKNKIYENVHNNLVQIYKSKGTYDSYRNVLNTMGISQKIVDINLYANNAEFQLLDNRKQILERKKRLNFFKSDYNSATCYQATSSNANSLGYIPETVNLERTPWTMESRFTLPKDNINSNYYFIENNILSCSLFGFHQPAAQNNISHTWATNDNTVQIYAIRDRSSLKDGYFYLTGAIDGTGTQFELTSSIIPNLFDDTDWNLAVSLEPPRWPLTSIATGSFLGDTSFLKFRGYNKRADIIDSEFSVSQSLTYTGVAQRLLSVEKKFYVGAHLENFTGSVYNDGKTFAKFDNFNFWLNSISNDDMKDHLKDPRSYGITNAYLPAFATTELQLANYMSSSFVPPNADTLALRWDFETVSSSFSSGEFITNDVTTTGSSTNLKYDWYGQVTERYEYSGRGFGFTANKADVVKTELVNSYKLSNPDTISSEQMIEIRTQDDEVFLPDKRPTEFLFAAEKSFYRTIDEKILETFSTLKDFNNLVGESANRYRPEYKELNKYRQLFFERITNDLDFEKFIEYYKWIDTSISSIIMQLTPATADFSPELFNVVESHILERNKYQHRFPAVKPMTAYSGSISASANSFFLSNKGKISLNLANENQITSSNFLSSSFNEGHANISSSIKNIIDTTYRNLSTSSYIQGADNINTIGVTRTSPSNKNAGNFLENHSIVMIPNKDGNNDLLLDIFDSVTPVADSFTVSGVVDYTLPDRPSQPSVITPRFSAPGGPEVNSLGYLDYESAQYSVYNNMNFRNLVVRQALAEMRTSASMDPTLRVNASGAASFNKNYRNPRVEYISGSGDGLPGTTASVFFDNAYINYATPASDVQYSWITASYESAKFLTRQTGSEDITWPRFLKDFPLASGLSDTTMPINVPFVASFLDGRIFASILDDSDGLFPLVAKEEWTNPITENLYSLFSVQNSIGNTGRYDSSGYPLNTDITDLAGGTAGMGGSPGNNNEVNRFWFNSTAPYGFNPWNMLRNRDGKQLLRIFNKHNVLSVADPVREISFVKDGKRRVQKSLIPDSVTNYIEPAVIRKYKPLIHTVVLDNDNQDVVKIKSSYALYNAGFANRSLNALLDIDTQKPVLSYDKVKSLYINSPDPENSAISGWLSVEYAENVWPKEKFQGVNSHRDKVNYDTFTSLYETTYNSRLGFFATRTFWRDDADARKRGTIFDGIIGPQQNSLGTAYGTAGSNNNGGNFTKNFFPLSDYSIADNTGSLGSACQVQLTFNATITSSAAALTISMKDVYSQQITFNSITGVELDGNAATAALALITQINTNSNTKYALTASSGGSGVVIIQTRYPVAVSGSDYLNNNPDTNWIDTTEFVGKITQRSEKVHLSGGTAPIFNRDAELNSSFLSLPGMSIAGVATQGYREEGYFGTHGVASEHYPDGTGDNTKVRPFYSYYFPQASQTYIHRPRPAMAGDLDEVAPYSGHPWRVAQSSSRNPFFDTHEQYVEFPKILTEHYSIIPEFNIVDHLEYYQQNNNDLRARNNKYFIIPGAKGKKEGAGYFENTSSATQETGSYNSTFFKNYLQTEFLQKFDSVQKDHAKIGQVGEITLTCKVLKKFKPQQGFYPIQRIMQIGTLFSQSLENNLSGYVSSSLKYETELQQFRVQSAIQPLFSPGIMYNSVKSGIAVDWPVIFSGSLSTVANTDLLCSSSLLIASDASKRVPFEALTDLNKYPRDVDVLYLYPSYHSGTVAGTNGARRPFFNWNGQRNNQLFEAAMDNFLSEVPNFYLENKNFTEFVSNVEGDFKAFESGKTYYMDVSLRQTNNHTMWRDYYDGTRANSQSYTGSYNGRAFGPGWNTASIEPTSNRIGADPAYAPYTPPYFYGESIARFSFTPSTSRKYTLDEIVAGSSVEYLTPDLLTGFSGSNSTYDAMAATAASYKNRMTLSASLNLFGKVRTKPDSPESSFDVWRISPKFECPVLNFVNQPSETYMSRGMWGGLGEISSGSEGVFMSVRDSFTGSIDQTTGSLSDQLGFVKQQKKIGNISQKTVLEEAIIAIPFLERRNINLSEAQVTTVEDLNLFEIDKNILSAQLSSSVETSITKMVNAMDKYVIPPNLNFMKYKDISPFVMYIFEFNAEFSQQDLAYMWQGVMPDISLDGNETFDQIDFSHKTGKEEFYHGKRVPSDIRWIVFKVKKKARKSYSDVVNLTSKDDQDYGYNWPYDYCSLVEMAKLDVKMKITPKKKLEDEDTIVGEVQ